MVKDSHAPRKKLKGQPKNPDEQRQKKGSSTARHKN